MIERPTYIKWNLDYDAEPNAPSLGISVNGTSLNLTFLLNPFLWDNVEDHEQAGLIFHNVKKYRPGGPGSDNFADFRYYNSEIDNYGFYEVKDSNWKNDFPNDWKVIPGHSISKQSKFRHFVFFFRDNTFECIADDFKFVRKDKIEKNK